MNSPARHGFLLFAHGARDSSWAAPLEATAQRLRALCPHQPVVLGFLEFLPPDIATAGRTLVEQGCTEVAVIPLFLGAGGHVRRDVPDLVEALRISHPNCLWHLEPAVGESPLLIEAMAQAAAGVLFPSATPRS